MSMSVSAIGPAHHEPRGVKRKRGKVPPVDTGAKIRGKLHHGLKVIHKVAKKEKTFEIQRLIKKKKGGGGQKQDDYDEQLKTLKGLDPEYAANLATKTKLGKDRLLSQNDAVRAAVETELSSDLLVLSEPGTTARVVESRFLSSKRLAIEIQTVLQAIKDELLGTSEGKAARPLTMLKAKAKSDQDNSAIRVQSASCSTDEGVGDDDDESFEAEDREDGEEDGAGWESGTVTDSNPKDGWESESVDDTGTSRGLAGRRVVSEADDSDPEASDASNASSSPAAKRKKQPEAKMSVQAVAKDLKGKSKASAAESTFLPSLSVGFIRGDSDGSDWSDAEANVADGMRKNRRGQRARRAIWEKKYGKNANHVKKAQETASRDGRQLSNRSNPNAKGAPRRDRGVPEGRVHRPGVHSASRLPDVRKSSHGRAPIASGPAPVRPTTKEEKPLHPSWEAKKRLKEKQNPVILPAQGKKITFN
ncbi:Bud-site selection protein [Daedalea quercina L-15889]|uniref:Bud-site selection protein n=1 Tax=Daedalea quercina L-15889 TaxID=1314783 RepID=A0A165TQJ6_9APHY|nr:Bud-site selection protein [Daedalea quercina L-15889]